jgi:hypothetical protein
VLANGPVGGYTPVAEDAKTEILGKEELKNLLREARGNHDENSRGPRILQFALKYTF